MTALEVNFDGLVGPTHHYGGLGRGNLASQANARRASSPRQAALQGLAKMRLMLDLGFTQGILLPHERPHVPTLRNLGFSGTNDAAIVEHAARRAPGVLSAASSASAMWTANAATVTPSPDTADARVHFTPANLAGHLHRSIEAPTTTAMLRAMFNSEHHFVVHDPIAGSGETGDEGAANHTRLVVGDHGDPGVALFVHGPSGPAGRFHPRQSAYASRAVARRHGVRTEAAVFVAQSPAAVDAGVFHNDVIAVGDRDLLLLHEDAFEDQPELLARLSGILGSRLRVCVVPASMLPLDEAVASYLFNSQLLTTPLGERILLAPADVAEHPNAAATAHWLETQGVDQVVTIDLRQSMRNGGGPACLRLRVVLTDVELAAVHPGVLVDHGRLDELSSWVSKHYRDELVAEDLADPSLLNESRLALDELTHLLGLGSLYEFQGA